MGHERGDLDDDWGYGSADGTQSPPPLVDMRISALDLGGLVQDPAALHTLCLDTFRRCAGPDDAILTVDSLESALNDIMTRIEADPFDRSDVLDLWFGHLNFAEYYLLVRELLVSMHRALTTDIDASDVLVNETNRIKI